MTKKLTQQEKDKKHLYEIFRRNVSEPAKQTPTVIDALNLFMAAIDGNGFYGSKFKPDGKSIEDQYTEESIEILTLGIKAFIKKHKIPNYKDHLFGSCLHEILDHLKTIK